MTDLCILIPVVNAQIFNPIAGLAIQAGTPTNEVKAKIETHPETSEEQIKKCSK